MTPIWSLILVATLSLSGALSRALPLATALSLIRPTALSTALALIGPLALIHARP